MVNGIHVCMNNQLTTSLNNCSIMHSIRTSVSDSGPVPQCLLQWRVCCEQFAGWSTQVDNLCTREEDRDNGIVHRLRSYMYIHLCTCSSCERISF